MIPDKLYDLAFSYKKTKLWKKLYDTQMFAVKLSDGKIGYICVMGIAGEYCALALYVGDKGFESYSRLLFNDSIDHSDLQEAAINQACLQCSFENSSGLAYDELDEVKDYAVRHDMKLRGRNAYPHFVKYAPECMPWYIENKSEQEQIGEALAAAIELSDLLENKVIDKPEYLAPITRDIILLEPENGRYKVTYTTIPPIPSPRYPEPMLNDLHIAGIKKLKKRDIWECRIVRITKPLQRSPKEAPTFPTALIARSQNSDILIPVMPVVHYNENSSEMMDIFCGFMLEQKICPKEIKVSDDLSYSFIKEFCKRTGIVLTRYDEMDGMDDIEHALFGHINEDMESDIDGDEDISEIFEALSQMSVAELKSLPEFIINDFKLLAESDMLPKKIVNKLNKAFGFGIKY